MTESTWASLGTCTGHPTVSAATVLTRLTGTGSLLIRAGGKVDRALFVSHLWPQAQVLQMETLSETRSSVAVIYPL